MHYMVSVALERALVSSEVTTFQSPACLQCSQHTLPGTFHKVDCTSHGDQISQMCRRHETHTADDARNVEHCVQRS
jgi:hypothetical protein